jgi:hypothetical protein
MSDQTMSTAPAIGARRVILVASAGLLAFERLALMGLMYLLTALILVNVVTRYSHFPIYWIDESAVYSVVWLTFIGASAMTRLRLDFAVTMMTERLSARSQQIFKIIATSTVIVFGIGLIVTCLLWMDPIGLAQRRLRREEVRGPDLQFSLHRAHPDAELADMGPLSDTAHFRGVDHHPWHCESARGPRPRRQGAAERLPALRTRRGELI